MLEKEVSQIFGYYPDTEFLLDVHTNQLNEADLTHIKLTTKKVLDTSSDNRAMNQAAKGKEEEFIFDIIKKILFT